MSHPDSHVPNELILLVDDEEFVLQVGKEILEALGYRVLTARNGREGLEEYDRHGAEIACILLDLTMPEMNGEEAFLEFRRRRTDLPIILSSGYSEEEVSEKFGEKQLTGFIEKPYNISTLRDKLHEALRK